MPQHVQGSPARGLNLPFSRRTSQSQAGVRALTTGDDPRPYRIRGHGSTQNVYLLNICGVYRPAGAQQRLPLDWPTSATHFARCMTSCRAVRSRRSSRVEPSTVPLMRSEAAVLNKLAWWAMQGTRAHPQRASDVTPSTHRARPPRSAKRLPLQKSSCQSVHV